jgi:hypothetical protein
VSRNSDIANLVDRFVFRIFREIGFEFECVLEFFRLNEVRFTRFQYLPLIHQREIAGMFSKEF